MGQAVLAALLAESVTLRPLADYEPNTANPVARSRLGRTRLRAVPELFAEARNDGVAPAVRGMIRRLLAVMLEAMDARRPVGQLRGQLDPIVYAAIQTRARTLARPLVSRIRSVHLCQPAVAAVEVCAVIQANHEVHALAARFELAAGSLRCTALRLI